MLKLLIPDRELFDESRGKYGEFIQLKGGVLTLEHSLLSISKWEQKWKKAFYKEKIKSDEESIDYIKCMMVDDSEDSALAERLTDYEMDKINKYMNDPMTATTFGKDNSPPSRNVVTAEVIYWEMFALGIPLEFERRHINHLFALIKVCSIKNSPPKKISKKDAYARNKRINEANRKKYNSKG